MARPDSSPKRISSGKIDGSTPWTSWYNIRQRVIVPKRVATERLGVLERRRYQVPPDSIWPGRSVAVVRLEVIEGPFDDDPTEFAKQLLQAGLEAMAGLGREVGPAEADDEATDLGDHRDQADRQSEQGGGEVRCQQEADTCSMVHRGGLSREGDLDTRPLIITRKLPRFQDHGWVESGTQAIPEPKPQRMTPESLALARSHPVQQTQVANN